MRRLIITADDFGLSVEVNEAVEAAHRDGLLSAASLMVAGPAAADAVRRAKRMPGLAVGLHLVLADGPAVLPASVIPRLAGKAGRLRSDLVRFGIEIALDRRARRQLNDEIQMQFEAFAATGLMLDHVNGHRHFHVHPFAAPAVLQGALAQRAGGLRVPLEPRRILRRIEPGRRRPRPAPTDPFAALLGRRARAAGLAVPTQVFGLAWSGAMTEARLGGLLRHLPVGLSEIYLHPATTDGFEGAAPAYRYAEELAALLSPDCREVVRANGIALGGYRAPRLSVAGGSPTYMEQTSATQVVRQG